MLAHSNPEMTGAVADEARKAALRVSSTDVSLDNRHPISNRHPCRLETTLNPCASTAAPLLIVTQSGVILAWVCAGADGLSLPLALPLPRNQAIPLSDRAAGRRWGSSTPRSNPRVNRYVRMRPVLKIVQDLLELQGVD